MNRRKYNCIYYAITTYFQEIVPDILVLWNGGNINLIMLCKFSQLRVNKNLYYVLECDRHSRQAMNTTKHSSNLKKEVNAYRRKRNDLI